MSHAVPCWAGGGYYNPEPPGTVRGIPGAGAAGILEDSTAMTHVIAEPCIGTKDASCVDVCPVDCIHPTKGEQPFESSEMLYIDPDTCIDCGLCVDECPVQAIFPEEDLPEEWARYIQINADWYRK